ncbi:predicted methanol dehydrogenase regulator MoxR-like ATPase [Methanocella arvoryzae MRE50]|uniref:Predicted methanol dehydrogenase regulator MoxR-like ATPase n=1 Tax=Methanocella arvoryzae (strain DSM 22066 / NBRC 105507 / MRE50) TaxID=351160 RepID=Q0W4E1_METAR|nr:predicted methanol dehydrogenase regulator MoxR-like ATPase [Methanocella arvoryzae MRE50]
MDMSAFTVLASQITGEIKKAIVGKDDLITDMLIALLSEGNVMLDGVPGLAKTTIAKAFASTLDLGFARMQFVPDILPSDVTGSYVFSQKDSSFVLNRGPVFTNLLLVDEVNRASPKTQSALLEAMEEKQVTIEGSTFPLPRPFMVITTQNPIDVVGTFPLPEAQIDRFMFKLKVDYPTADEELEILKMKERGEHGEVARLLALDDVVSMINLVKRVYVDEKVLMYIRDLIMASRSHEKLLLGGSPRASIALLRASRAVAAIRGREYVIPDDVKYLAPRVLNHRLIVKPEYEFEEVSPADIVQELLNTVKVPE